MTHPPRRRIAPWVLGGALLLLAISVTGAGYYLHHTETARWHRVRATNNALLAENIDYFCEQQSLAAADPFFAGAGSKARDASPLLSKWLPWDDGKPGHDEPSSESPLRFPVSHAASRDALKNWLTARPDTQGLDFSWMKQLHAYDHWDLTANNPVLRQERINWVTAAIPNFITLQTWTKYRLLAALENGDHAAASRDVRHLARLAYSTDMLLGAAVATAILKLERDAFETVSPAPADWAPMERAQIERLGAVVISSGAFSSIAAPPELAARARSCSTPAITRCIALTEGVAMGRFAAGHPPEELVTALASLEREAKEGSCPLARVLWERGATFGQTTDDFTRPPLVRYTPAAFGEPLFARIFLSHPAAASIRRLTELKSSTGATVQAER